MFPVGDNDFWEACYSLHHHGLDPRRMDDLWWSRLFLLRDMCTRRVEQECTEGAEKAFRSFVDESLGLISSHMYGTLPLRVRCAGVFEYMTCLYVKFPGYASVQIMNDMKALVRDWHVEWNMCASVDVFGLLDEISFARHDPKLASMRRVQATLRAPLSRWHWGVEVIDYVNRNLALTTNDKRILETCRANLNDAFARIKRHHASVNAKYTPRVIHLLRSLPTCP